MLHWVTCSSLIFLVGASSGWAQEGLTQDEALRLAFPSPATIQRHTAYLDPQQLASAKALAGPDIEVSQSVVTYYVGVDQGVPVGAAYFDGHVVRSKREVAMVVVDREGRVRLVEVLRFEEPPEYRASKEWLLQFKGQDLSAGLSLKGSILNLTGATLTSRALVGATRRVLALHRVVNPFGGAR